MTALAPSQIDADFLDAIKAAHRNFPSGVTIVAAQGSEQPVGLAVNAFSSVSMDPPMILVCVNRASKSHDALFAAEHIGVSIVAQDQQDVIGAFARSGGNKFAEVAWHPGESGAPMIDGAAAGFEIRVTERIAAGTHTVFIGEVVAAFASENNPMIYLQGGFHSSDAITASAN